MNNNMLEFKLQSLNATRSTKPDFPDIVHEIYSAEDKIIPAGGRASIETDISFTFPFGYYGLLLAIPELAITYSIDIINSVVQSGENTIKVLLINNSKVDFVVYKGDIICHMIINKYIDPQVFYCKI